MTSGLALLFRNPVVEHEFVRYCRTRRWFFVRTALVLALTLVLWLFFLQGRGDILAGNLDAVGRSLFSAASFVLVLFVLLAAPGMTADLIAAERRSGNIEVLLSTPLPKSGIVFGKVLSRVSLLLVIVASSFPAISITLLFGGVQGEQVAALFLVAVGLVLGLAGPSLFLSTLAERAGLSAVLAYLAAGIPAVLLLLPSPNGQILGLVHRIALPPPGGPTAGTFLPSALVVLVLGALAFFLGGVLSVARLGALRAGRAAGAASPRRLRRARARSGWDRGNPIATFEARRVRGLSGFGPFWTIFLLLVLLEAAALLFPGFAAGLGPDRAHAAVVTVEAFVILLFAALAGATTVVTDREQGRIELFRLTDLTPREVVHGKALGTARAVLPLALFPTLHLLVAGGPSPTSLGATALFLVILATALGVCAADGVMNSIQGATVQSAVLRSIWHFCWLTLFLPLVQFLLPLVFSGKAEMPKGPQFSLLYPLHHSAALALGISTEKIDVFGFVFWLIVLGIMAVGLAMLLAHGTPRRPARRGRNVPPPLGDWRESWERLAAQWDEED